MAVGLFKLSLALDQRALFHNLEEQDEIWTKLCDAFEKKKANRCWGYSICVWKMRTTSVPT